MNSASSPQPRDAVLIRLELQSKTMIYPRNAGRGLVVELTEQLMFSAKDVLKGRVDFDAVTARYVILYSTGLIGPATGGAEKLILAINYMAKLGWRVAGYSGLACIMENPERA